MKRDRPQHSALALASASALAFALASSAAAELASAPDAAAHSAAAAAPPPRVLFSLPVSLPLDNSSVVRVNPTATPLDETLVDFWRLGAGPLAAETTWDVSAWTGSGIASRAESRALLPPASVNGSTAMQFAGGVFGASLNLFETPLAPPDSLGTITIENNWSPATRVQPWAPAQGGAVLDMSVRYQAFSGFRTGVAVYSSWSLGLSNARTQRFVWYETALWDLDRDLGGDELWIDTISGNVIVHGVLGAPSDFHTMTADSAASSNACWSGFRLFHWTISAGEIAKAIQMAEAKFNTTLGADPADWELVHTNIELEGTPGVRGAHSLANMTISLTSA